MNEQRSRAVLPLPPTAFALVFVTGTAALLGDFLEVRQGSIYNMHVFFGLLLAVVVAVNLVRRRHALGHDRQQEFYSFSRSLARCIYILLYALAAVRLCLYLVETLSTAPGVGAHRAGLPVRSLDDFQIYVAYGVVPLWIIRLYLVINRRSVSRAS